MPRLNELTKAPSLSFFIYGVSGVGKTTFGGSIGSRGVIFDLGKASTTLSSNQFKKLYPNSNPIVEVITETTDARGLVKNPTAYDELSDLLDKYIGSDEVDVIVIDDFTVLIQFALNKALDINKDERKSQTLDKAISGRTIPITMVQDYGTLIDILKFFIGTYTQLCREHGKHFIVLGHPRYIYKTGKIGEEPKPSKIIPSAPGKDTFAVGQLPAMFDEIYFMYLEGGKNRALKTQATGIHLAKTSYPMELSDPEVNTDFPSILQKIKGVI